MSYHIPLIRLEVEGMRHTLVTALTQHQAMLDEELVKAVNTYCEPDNISRIIQEMAREELGRAIAEEVENFFRRGNGRAAVAKAVKQALLNNETYTPLDGVEEEG